MTKIHEWNRDGFTVSTDASRLQLDVIHGFLSRSYWAEGIPLGLVARSIEGSLAFGLYHGSEQVGFARVISDQATFAYVADVFVLPVYRGKGLARWLMECILETPELQGLRRWLLTTKDAHALYRGVGFSPTAIADRMMEINRPGLYRSQPEQPES
jgi:GNAT superfamily N-acetyltransferase